MPTVVGVVTAFLITWDSVSVSLDVSALRQLRKWQEHNNKMQYCHTVIQLYTAVNKMQICKMLNIEYPMWNAACCKQQTWSYGKAKARAEPNRSGFCLATVLPWNATGIVVNMPTNVDFIRNKCLCMHRMHMQCVYVCVWVSEWLNEHVVRLVVVCVDEISENRRATAVWHSAIQLQMRMYCMCIDMLHCISRMCIRN